MDSHPFIHYASAEVRQIISFKRRITTVFRACKADSNMTETAAVTFTRTFSKNVIGQKQSQYRLLKLGGRRSQK